MWGGEAGLGGDQRGAPISGWHPEGTVSPPEGPPVADCPQHPPFAPGFPGSQEPELPQGRKVWGAGGGVQGDLGAGVPLCAQRWGAAALGSERGSRGPPSRSQNHLDSFPQDVIRNVSSKHNDNHTECVPRAQPLGLFGTFFFF